jgi:SpoVK/Ycf46/Vps4 family AAA+-type ATPase
MIDEIEKAFAGVGSSGQTDSGVTARMFGSFLSWLNDHKSDVFVVATSNDISKLPPEFGRSERFDGIVFVDLREQKNLIWEQYIQLFELEPGQSKPKDKDWSGAEIRACCRLAALLDVPLKQAASNVVPIAVTAAEAVNRNRIWASGRCLDAEKGGIYQYRGAKSKRRSVKVDPSLN